MRIVRDPRVCGKGLKQLLATDQSRQTTGLSKVKPASLPKLEGSARIGGSCEAARRDSPRENSAGNQMRSTAARGRRAARRFAYRQLHVHTATVAPRRGAARRRRRRDAALCCDLRGDSVRGGGGKS
ncbi:hypothetical protein ALC53_05962 [Atta colombica]|uniref:Uncharacterized protein n=1 Tax=Atta colombica TaxID=520822 RepID=A0A195BG44_9HYME|nr:hypothetical protein ALC53_05962 [Atta colombica]